jgi:hypothetical protein
MISTRSCTKGPTAVLEETRYVSTRMAHVTNSLSRRVCVYNENGTTFDFNVSWLLRAAC